MKIKKLVSVFMMGVMLASSTPVNVFANSEDIASDISGDDITASGSAVTVSNESISIDFNVTGKWDNGFNGEITVNNLTDKVIENWQIKFEFPQEITNIWNAAVVSHEDIVYTVKNSGGNNNVNIPVGGSVTFGFSGTYEGEIIAPQDILLVGEKTFADEDDYTIKYELLSDWGSGYTAQITITNKMDEPMEGWHLEFDYAREITSIWNAVVDEQEAGRYCISNAEYNSVIPANGSIAFGFNGTGGNSENEPGNYKLIHSGNIIYTNNDENEEIDYEKDTDADKLPDWFEEIIGSSIDKIDSDEDGLTDYDEIISTGTDPIKYDTDDDGVCDADEDTDGDNITNSYELEFGTNPSNADTDNDDLNDYDELYIYHTDPLKYDTDDDGLSDGDEILLGLSPNKKDTDNDGVWDCDEKIQQTIKEDILCEELPGISNIAVTIEVSGNIEDSVDIENMYNKNILSSDLIGIEGAPMNITCSKTFDTAEIVFTYDEAKLDITPENLGILWYNEDEQFYEVMDTTLDKNNHCISMTTPHFSEYTVVDLTEWFEAWEQKIDYETTSIAKKNASWNGKVVTAQQLCDEYNTFFGYDDIVQLNHVLGACESGDIYAKTAIVQVKLKNGVELYYPCIFMALSEFNGIALSVTDYNAYPVPDCGGWSVSYVDYDQAEYQFEHFDDYGNIWPKYEDINYIGRQFYNNYFVPSGQVDTTDDDNDGLYDIYELTGMRIANGQVIYTKTNTDAAEEENETLGYDTDGDGLSDGEEIIRQDTERGYFVLKSDPNSDDSDDDGLYDDEDPEPLVAFIRYYSITDEEYIKISGNTEKYGGNQGWFSTNDPSFNISHIKPGGCGIISGSDLILYLQRNNANFSGITNVDTNYTSTYGAIKYVQYEDFVKFMAEYYIPPFDMKTGFEKLFGSKIGSVISNKVTGNTGTWGVSHYVYMLGLDRYFDDYSNIDIKLKYTYILNGQPINDLSAYFLLAAIDVNLAENNIDIAAPNLSNMVSNSRILNTNKNEVLKDIEASLSNNTPVPLLIGYEGKVYFYSDPELKCVAYNQPIGSHWVNITGLMYDKSDGKTKLIISSWGEKFYIDFEDVYNNPGLFGGIVLLDY